MGEALAGLARRFVPFDGELSNARMVKTSDEIAALRHAAEVAAVGQREALRATAAGRTELEVFADIRCAMETAAGGRVCVAGEYSSGVDRTPAVFDWPRNRRLEIGDPVVADIAPRVAGYWGDSCNTLVIGGEPSAEQRRVLAAAQAGIDKACETLRPGITAAEFDAGVRAAVVAAGGVELRASLRPRHRHLGAREPAARAGRPHRAAGRHGDHVRARHLPAGHRLGPAGVDVPRHGHGQRGAHRLRAPHQPERVRRRPCRRASRPSRRPCSP